MGVSKIWLVCLMLLLAASLQMQGCASVTTRPTVDPMLTSQEAGVQRRMAAEERTELADRLSRVSLPVLVNGLPLCGDRVTWYLGMETASEDLYAAEWRQAYREVLGVNEHVTVTRVYEATPAQAAGLRKGDRILMVNGVKIEPGKKCYDTFHERLDAALKHGRPVSFWIERDGAPRLVEAIPAQCCGYPVIMDDSEEINALATGDTVIVNKGLLKFTETDAEIALIVGHELAHNVLEHGVKASGNQMLGAAVDGIIAGITGVYSNAFTNAGTMAYSQEFEQEADYVGIYFMERGGYDSTETPKFWRRMGANNPYSISHASSHPTSASRTVFLEECVKEIKAKREAGRALLPEFKKTATR
ncbi:MULTISPECIES: M48 family metallopeptidase [Pseudodesulfovibrio]|uniref:Peptidase M48 Ste24p n=1 Tax=Pseudodesulfovibrio aespoeensis (strain ATCC 700646 / DSM 10631 / Aspo-2) TaxID=643562 RepID=E6VYK5_PSEA9|nr:MULTISPECIES: M48 family metallopeptidase [Pseudodesulfovibrio]ADU62768.1 peptidase M48 Ste24p [Pseudodesulfovibrio aespoeensis Aspo-2]MCG2731708.1 M48 family metallopeptidase [Pseudodesulfovibrio aespoeensis]